mmetsp:Transcript_42785/g.119046  ORF Transcript_42785/g.119046 Transcript_42785/m.119046 type:complete len:354 (-) Transcript_42785:227-1288(-)
MQQVTLRRLAGATLQVLGQQGAQLILRVPYPAALQADGLAAFRPLEDVANRASVAVRPRVAPRDLQVAEDALQPLGRGVRQHQHVLEQHLVGDLQELVGGVIVEFEDRREAAAQPRVGVQQLGHFDTVTGDDHDEVCAEVLHEFDEGVQSLTAERVLAILADEGVGLVHEEDTAQCALHDGFRFQRGLAAVAGDEGGAVRLDQVPCTQQTDRLHELCDDPCDGGLAGAWVALEHHVQGGAATGTLDAHLPALLLELELRVQGPHELLHWAQAHDRVQLPKSRLRRVALVPRAVRKVLLHQGRQAGEGQRLLRPDAVGLPADCLLQHGLRQLHVAEGAAAVAAGSRQAPPNQRL